MQMNDIVCLPLLVRLHVNPRVYFPQLIGGCHRLESCDAILLPCSGRRNIRMGFLQGYARDTSSHCYSLGTEEPTKIFEFNKRTIRKT
jgi:hypothetical protein